MYLLYFFLYFLFKWLLQNLQYTFTIILSPLLDKTIPLLNPDLTEMLFHHHEVLEWKQTKRKKDSNYPFILNAFGQGIPMASDPDV